MKLTLKTDTNIYALLKVLKLFSHASSFEQEEIPARRGKGKEKRTAFTIKFKNKRVAFKMGVYYGSLQGQLFDEFNKHRI